MPSFKYRIQLVSVLPLLFLAGCGEGWEMRPYEGTPYGDRTAGYGVEYVRANMAPKKGPILDIQMPVDEPAAKPEPEPEPEPEPVAAPDLAEEPLQSADELFDKAQRK